MQEIQVRLTVQEAEVIMQGLLKLTGEVMLPTLQKFDAQVRAQLSNIQQP